MCKSLESMSEAELNWELAWHAYGFEVREWSGRDPVTKEWRSQYFIARKTDPWPLLLDPKQGYSDPNEAILSCPNFLKDAALWDGLRSFLAHSLGDCSIRLTSFDEERIFRAEATLSGAETRRYGTGYGCSGAHAMARALIQAISA